MIQQLTKRGHEGLLSVYIVISLTLLVLKIWLKTINETLSYPHVATLGSSVPLVKTETVSSYIFVSHGTTSRLIGRPVRFGLVRRWATKQAKLV